MRKIFRFGFVNFVAMTLSAFAYGQSYIIVGTNQTNYYNNTTTITAPSVGQSFYGQDAHYPGNVPSYTNNGDGTITDNVTGLMWSKTPDLDGDGDIDYDDKLTYTEALAYADNLELAGFTDWRLPTIKEQYSLILFNGEDPSGYEGTSTEGLVPFIDTNYFDFGYGDLSADERIIDAQFATSTLYVSTTMMGDETMFGANFADGRIKGYGTGPLPGQTENKHFYVYFVRGNTNYGINDFIDNGNGTITDNATGLMWMQNDNGEGVLWENALSYAENFEFAGYSNWRLPNVKELQSIVDYTRAPDITNSAAINPLFNCSQITDEGGNTNYPFYWSGTTHANWTEISGGNAAYLCFGEALGWMEMPPSSGNYTLLDVHGAGAQRSDPKTGDPDDYPYGFGPQGDVIRIYIYVRLVRDTVNTTGMNELKPEDNIKIYPNPANEIININLASINKMNDLLIYNQLGEAIYYENISSKNEIRIDVSDFSTGLYFVRITDENIAYSDKFIVQ